MIVKPSRKVTVPEIGPEPIFAPVTEAVKVTDWPKIKGLVEELRVVEVARVLTVWLSEPELAAKLESPLKVAAMVCPPTERAEVVMRVAMPPDRVPEPSMVEPSMNVTVPEGEPAPGALTETVAVKVMASP